MIFDGFELITLKQNLITLGTIVLLAISVIIVGTYYFISFPYAKVSKDSIYSGSTITEAEIKEIEEIDQYIENKKTEYDRVIVFSTYAMLYENTFKDNNKFFDLPNRGNFGKNGEQTLIDEITNMNNTLILVQDENSEYEIYQFPKNVRNYIKDNYERIDKLQNYDIYVINNK
jgi:tyrosyl-tRNA synthetase